MTTDNKNKIKQNNKKYHKKRFKKFLKKIVKLSEVLGAFSLVGGAIWKILLLIAKYIVDIDRIANSSVDKSGVLLILLDPMVDFIISNITIIITIIYLIISVMKICILPNIKAYKEDRPQSEVAPNKLEKVSLIMKDSIFIIFITLSITIQAKTVETPTNDSSDSKVEIKEDDGDTNKNILSKEKQFIDEYINKCCAEVLPKEKLEKLSNSELKYIRNGIYAHEGYYFSSGYFDDFIWYNGNITPENFSDDMLSDTQMKNVLNIRAIEKERGIY